MGSIMICEQINSSTTNLLMLARIFQHAVTPVTALLTHFLVLSMTFDHRLPHLKNPNVNPVKHSSPIDVITSLTAKIANESNHDTGRNVVLSATKKAAGPQNTPRMNRKSRRDDSRNVTKNASLRISTEMRGNTSLNTKELTTMMMKKILKKMAWRSEE